MSRDLSPVVLKERSKEGRHAVLGPLPQRPRRPYRIAEHSALTGVRLFPRTEGLGECAAWIRNVRIHVCAKAAGWGGTGFNLKVCSWQGF